MSDDQLTYLCIGCVIVVAVLIILIANWADRRRKKKQGERLMRDKANGTYDEKKKYFGDQGNWEPGEGAPGNTDWNNYNRD